MEMFSIILFRDATKFLESLDNKTKERIKKKLKVLENDPHPIGCVKLIGTEKTFRIRIGDFRVLYFVDYANSKVFINRIAKRSKVYERAL